MLFSLFRGKSTTTKEKSDKVEIKIRYVDPVTLKKSDEIVKEKKISRQEFLKGQIETLAVFQERKDREAESEHLIDRNIKMMGKCALAIETIICFLFANFDLHFKFMELDVSKAFRKHFLICFYFKSLII
jgi:hypothetical protein